MEEHGSASASLIERGGPVAGIVLPTVRHTGSLFWCAVLAQAGYERVTLRGEDKPLSLVFDHVYPKHMGAFKRWLSRFPTLVVPLRDPQATAVGWCKRGEMSDYFWRQWRNLVSLDSYEPTYVTIDTADRQARLGALSRRIGAPLATDWKPINTSLRPARDVPDVSELYEWPVIRDVYPDGPPRRLSQEELMEKRKFRFVREVEGAVRTYDGHEVVTGDVIELEGHFAAKAMNSPDFQVYADAPGAAGDIEAGGQKSLAELRSILDAAGVAVDRRWGRKRLEEMVRNCGD